MSLEASPRRAPQGGLRGVGLCQAYRGRPVLNDVEMELCAGEVVGLLGPNGSGKTTALSILAGLVRPSRGQVFLGEDEVTGLGLHARAQRGIAYIPQESSVFTRLTVRENLLALTEFHDIQRAECEVRLEKVVRELGLGDLLASRGAQLSGGERRRVEIGRALMLGARFLLLDEPFAGLDPHGRAEVGRIFEVLSRSGQGVLVTDHSFEDVVRFTSRLYLLAQGQILSQGQPEAVLADPQAQAAYFGQPADQGTPR